MCPIYLSMDMQSYMNSHTNCDNSLISVFPIHLRNVSFKVGRVDV